MDYKFKKNRLSDGERIWIEELYKNINCEIDISMIKVKLWSKLPENFDPDKIDYRIVNNSELTLIGLWYIDPDNILFKIAEKIMSKIKQLIINNPKIYRFRSYEIADIISESQENVEIAFNLLYRLSLFFGSASSNSKKFGYTEVCLREGDSKFDNILKFRNIEHSMEEYFLKTKVIKKSIIQNKIQRNDSNQNIVIWTKIKDEYGISKRGFGKKINFIKDTFKRKIIFRDVAQAFELANSGFFKPSVILSGSVIEELLRLYLIENDISYKRNSFNEYIKICEDKGLIKKGTSRLSDSVRHFRNLVHLLGEENSKYTISKSTAKGAVSSIFTIINNF